MKTFLFSWNPTRAWKTAKEDIDKLQNGSTVIQDWRIGSHRQVALYDRAFVARVGAEPKGIVAAGRIISTPYEDTDSLDSSKMIHYVSIEFDTILYATLDPKAELLNIDTLKEKLDQHDWAPRPSGREIPPAIAEGLESIWIKLPEVALHYRSEFYKQKGGMEGKLYRALGTRYERNPYLRKLCIEEHGYSCCVCGFDFEQAFGELGKGFIHVHHLEQLASAGKEHYVDPTTDMRPVCPNCHAMIHKTVPPYSIEEMKEIRVLPF